MLFITYVPALFACNNVFLVTTKIMLRYEMSDIFMH